MSDKTRTATAQALQRAGETAPWASVAAAEPDVVPAIMGAWPVPAGGVLHLVDRIDHGVFAFLAPAAAALAARGVPQTLVATDMPAYRAWLDRFDPSVHLVRVRAREPRWRHWRELLRQFAQAARQGRPARIHLHGFTACLLGSLVARRLQPAVPTYFSAHESRALGLLRGPARATLWMLRPALGDAHPRPIAQEPRELDTLSTLVGGEAALVERSVAQAYLRTARRVARQPLVVTQVRTPDARAAGLFSQFAVLLGDERLRLRFLWIGPVGEDDAARLRAAQVVVVDPEGDDARAVLLAEAWVYVEVHHGGGVASGLAEAMALGLPCVAPDTTAARGMIRHGETGLLCPHEQALLRAIATLVDDEPLRERLGRAAREEARSRFDAGSFEDSLLSAYGL